MSGRGKGGKGLGKGGAKRHRKVLRDNIQGAACVLLACWCLSVRAGAWCLAPCLLWTRPATAAACLADSERCLFVGCSQVCKA